MLNLYQKLINKCIYICVKLETLPYLNIVSAVYINWKYFLMVEIVENLFS